MLSDIFLSRVDQSIHDSRSSRPKKVFRNVDDFFIKYEKGAKSDVVNLVLETFI